MDTVQVNVVELPPITQYAAERSAVGDYAWALTERETQLQAALAVNREVVEWWRLNVGDGTEVFSIAKLSSLINEYRFEAKSLRTANREKDALIERLKIDKHEYKALLAASEAELTRLRASVGGEKWIEIKPHTRLTDQMEVGRWMGAKWTITRMEHFTEGWVMIRPNDFYTHYRMLAPPSLPTEKE